MSINFVHHDFDSVSINVVYCSSHTGQNNQKINQKQLKCLVSILIKMFFTFYTVRFYSLTGQLWLKVKRVADWMRCNIIHSKISQNSRAYEMKNMWLQNFIQYIMYQIKHVISFWHSFAQNIFWIWNFINIDLIDLLVLALESAFVISDCFQNVN